MAPDTDPLLLQTLQSINDRLGALESHLRADVAAAHRRMDDIDDALPSLVADAVDRALARRTGDAAVATVRMAGGWLTKMAIVIGATVMVSVWAVVGQLVGHPLQPGDLWRIIMGGAP